MIQKVGAQTFISHLTGPIVSAIYKDPKGLEPF